MNQLNCIGPRLRPTARDVPPFPIASGKAEKAGPLETIAALRSFNRMVAHDLRGPLANIVGLSRLSSRALERDDLTTCRRMLTLISNEAQASCELVAALLTLASIDEARIDRVRTDTTAEAHAALRTLRGGESPASCDPVHIDQLDSVRSDPRLLRQLYVNLIGNALKFTGPTEAPRIDVGSYRERHDVVLYVRDNGIGFDSSAARNLFEPFERLHGHQFAGHGVGLSIVKKVVDRHHGRLWCESRPACGATFFVALEAA